MDSLGLSIIIITLILAMTALLSVSICLLRRHLNRRHLSTTSSTCRVAPENPTASSSSLIDSSSRSTSSAGGGGGECTICLSKLEPREQLRLLPLCCHRFHADCVNKWLESNSTCPICRSPISASDSDVLRAIDSSSGANGSSRLSSRTFSFRSSGRFFSGRFFTGSSRRTEYDIEANLHAGAEISELFRWISVL